MSDDVQFSDLFDLPLEVHKITELNSGCEIDKINKRAPYIFSHYQNYYIDIKINLYSDIKLQIQNKIDNKKIKRQEAALIRQNQKPLRLKLKNLEKQLTTLQKQEQKLAAVMLDETLYLSENSEKFGVTVLSVLFITFLFLLITIVGFFKIFNNFNGLPSDLLL